MKLHGVLIAGSVSLILTVASLNAFAGNNKHRAKDYKGMAMAVAEVSAFTGWYAGVGVGVNTYNMNANFTTATQTDGSPFLSGVFGDIFDNNARSTVNKFGPMGNLFLGYGYVNDIYYVGANAGVNIVGAKMLNTNQTNYSGVSITDANDSTAVYYDNTFTTQTKVSRSWLEPFLDIKLGGLITPDTLAYAIGGVSVDRVSMQSISFYCTSASVPGVSHADTNSVLNYSKSRNLVGLRLGAGAETMVTAHFGVAAQYVYSFFPTFNSSSTINSTVGVCDTELGCTTTPVSITNTTQTSLSDQQVLVQFIYHI